MTHPDGLYRKFYMMQSAYQEEAGENNNQKNNVS